MSQQIDGKSIDIKVTAIRQDEKETLSHITEVLSNLRKSVEFKRARRIKLESQLKGLILNRHDVIERLKRVKKYITSYRENIGKTQNNKELLYQREMELRVKYEEILKGSIPVEAIITVQRAMGDMFRGSGSTGKVETDMISHLTGLLQKKKIFLASLLNQFKQIEKELEKVAEAKRKVEKMESYLAQSKTIVREKGTVLTQQFNQYTEAIRKYKIELRKNLQVEYRLAEEYKKIVDALKPAIDMVPAIEKYLAGAMPDIEEAITDPEKSDYVFGGLTELKPHTMASLSGLAGGVGSAEDTGAD